MHVIYTKYGISLKIAISVRNTMINHWIVVDLIFGPWMDPNGWIAPCQLPAEGWRTVSYLEDYINFTFRNWLSGHISQSCQSGQENSFRDLLIFIHVQQLHTWPGPSACIPNSTLDLRSFASLSIHELRPRNPGWVAPGWVGGPF